MKKLIVLLLMTCLFINTHAQTVTTSSSSMTAESWLSTVPYDISDEGTEHEFMFGMGGWSWDFFGYQQRNHCGVENLDIARIGFTGRFDSSYDALTDAQKAALDTEITNTLPTGVKKVFLLCGIGNDGNQQGDLASTPTWSTTQRNNYVNDIVMAAEYVESKGYEIFAVAPFNEPDFEKTYTGNASNFNAVAAIMQTKPILAGKVFGPSTLNSTEAKNWYPTVKENINYANTHQLSGTKFTDYTSFWNTAKNDGKSPVADEMHNVMEAMICINYGGVAGTWWGWDGITRGEYIRMTKGGVQLVYKEFPNNWMTASVNKYKTGNRVEAFIGTSERQAVKQTLTFRSKDRLAYYDGNGPTYEYNQDVPGGASGSYQEGQTNAERLININTGEDVPIEHIHGKYKIVNKATGKVLTLAGGNAEATGNIYQWTDGGMANQSWDVYPVDSLKVADYSYVVIRNSNTSRLNLYLDAQEWNMDNGANASAWSGDSIGQPDHKERWHLRYVKDGYYNIISHYSGLFLDVNNGNVADGTNVMQWEGNGGDNQLWKFVPADHAVDATAPTMPTGLTATPQSGGVKLTWNANTDSDLYRYMVYRYNDAIGIWECIGRKVQGTAFLDNTCSKWKTYRYRIKALDKSYNFSAASAETSSAASTTPSLVAQWSGMSVKDSGPNKMHFAYFGTTFTTDSEHASISFDGTDDYVKLPYHAGDMNTMTFTAWVKGSSTTAWQRIFDFGNGEDEYLFLTPTNGSAMRFEIKKDDVTQGLNATTTLGTGTWKHIAVTIGAEKVKIYIDGTENASTSDITLRPSDIAPTVCTLGRSQFDSDPRFKGLMSDIRLYNYELTGSEILALANITSNTGGYDVTAERIPNIADNVSNWTVTGSWATWSSTADGSGLTSPYVRIGTSGTSKISKTLTYLPEGVYQMSASCMSYYYSNGFFGIGAGEKDISGVTLFANSTSTNVNTKNNKAAKTLSVSGEVSNTNTLEIGMNASATDATILAMDNVKLIYQGSSAEYIEGIENITYNKTANAEALVNKRMNTDISDALRTALNNISTSLNNYTTKIASGTATPNDVEPWIAAMNALSTTAAENSIAQYAKLEAQLTAAREKAATHPQQNGNETFNQELGVVESKFNNGEYADSEIDAAIIEVIGITNRYVMADAVANASASNPIDVSDLIVNCPRFDNDQWAPHWTASPTPGVSYNCIEFFNTNFNVYQTIYGLPAGTYRLQTRAFYRYGSQDNNYTAHNNGTLQRNAKLYISDSKSTQTVDILAISDDPTENPKYGGWSSQTYNGYKVPDNMQAGSDAIEVENQYVPQNGCGTVDIVSEGGDITIGARKDVTVDADWTFFGDFTLYYVGAPEMVLDELSGDAPVINNTFDKVTLKRTIKPNTWSTFVCPFDIPASSLSGWEVKELVRSEMKGDVISLVFGNAPDGIKSGVPYMVRNTSLGSPLTEIVMANATVNTTVKNDKETDHVTFTCVYHNGYVPEGAYFISGNKFYLAADGSNTMKGYRAYFMPKGQVANVKGMSFTWEEDVTDVETTISSAEIVGIYNISGVRLNEMQRGINILQMSDGTTQKVIIR